MAGRPSATTLAQLTERLEQVELKIARPETQGFTPNPAEPPVIKSTWSADLEARVALLETRMEKMVGFLKQMHSM